MIKCRSMIIVLILTVLLTSGCLEQQHSVYVQDKHTTNTFGGTQRYYIVDGPTTYECANSSIYDALDKGSTYTVVVSTASGNNMITKVIS